MTFLISVKVVNQVIYDHSLVQFQPVDGAGAESFTDVYGDCFISGKISVPQSVVQKFQYIYPYFLGYQEGGIFTAVISVKAKDESRARQIKAE